MKRLCECGAGEGQFHRFGCRWEQCPFCERLFGVDCECQYDFLGLRSSANPPEQAELSREVYTGVFPPNRKPLGGRSWRRGAVSHSWTHRRCAAGAAGSGRTSTWSRTPRGSITPVPVCATPSCVNGVSMRYGGPWTSTNPAPSGCRVKRPSRRISGHGGRATGRRYAASTARSSSQGISGPGEPFARPNDKQRSPTLGESHPRRTSPGRGGRRVVVPAAG
jgi:hypothetical protein